MAKKIKPQEPDLLALADQEAADPPDTTDPTGAGETGPEGPKTGPSPATEPGN